jgi:hypothetical protein
MIISYRSSYESTSNEAQCVTNLQLTYQFSFVMNNYEQSNEQSNVFYYEQSNLLGNIICIYVL